MLTNVFTHAITQSMRAILLFSIGIVAVTAMYVGVFPDFQDQMEGYADAIPEAMAAFMGNDFASPAGYIGSTSFGILGPVLFVAAAVTSGAAAIAGEEEDHTLALVMTAPVTRTRLATEKAAAVVVGLTALGVVLFAALVGIAAAVNVDITTGQLLAGSLHLHAFSLLAAGIAFGVGAATGRKALALGVATGVVVAGYVMNGIGGLLELDWLQLLSPFHWYAGTEPVRNGVAWGWLGLLYAFAGIAIAAGIWRFDRRDLT